MGTLYLLTSPVGKSYIGISSKTTEKRWAKHVEHAMGKRDNGALYAALRKYGPESFTVRTLVICNDWDYLCELEVKAILAYRTRSPYGYNISAGGEGVTGERDEEFKRKVSSAQKKRFERSSERERMAEISRAISAEVRVKARIKATKTMRSPEFRARASEIAIRQFSDPQARKKLGDAIRASVTEEGRKAASVRMKAFMADPEKRRAVSNATRAAMRRTDTVEKVKVAASIRAADPNWRKKVSESKKGAILGPMAEGHKAKIAEARRREWSDPSVRQIRLEALVRARGAKASKKLVSPHPQLQQALDGNPELIDKIQNKRDETGRYHLTLIHNIAGGAERYRPKYFLALESTQRLVRELSRDLAPVESLRGAKGTYAIGELAVAYMRWIDPSIRKDLTI